MQIRSIPNELQETAKRELNEVPSRIEDDIKHIREWLALQPHLRCRTEDQWILSFLRGCKFSLERAKEKLDLFYTMRGLLQEYFTNRDPFLPDIQELLSLGLVLPLPKTVGTGGPRIILCRYGNFDPRLPFVALVKMLLMITDIMLYEDDNFTIAGQHVFIDLSGSSLEYFPKLNLTDVKKLEICLEKAYPSRPQAFDVTNAPAFYESLFNIVQPLLSEKVKGRLHIYAKCNSENIYKIIPRSHLPKEYGGDCSTVAELTAHWKQKVESYKDWFLEDEKYGIDESKRPGKPKTSEEMFGVEGSFRKLDVD